LVDRILKALESSQANNTPVKVGEGRNGYDWVQHNMLSGELLGYIIKNNIIEVAVMDAVSLVRSLVRSNNNILLTLAFLS
jgi:hypothetical protein